MMEMSTQFLNDVTEKRDLISNDDECVRRMTETSFDQRLLPISHFLVFRRSLRLKIVPKNPVPFYERLEKRSEELISTKEKC